MTKVTSVNIRLAFASVWWRRVALVIGAAYLAYVTVAPLVFPRSLIAVFGTVCPLVDAGTIAHAVVLALLVGWLASKS